METPTIRIFISSTFRDMHAERDHLNRFVFPALRARCRRRGAELIAVDLRWGLTEEETERRGALSICLDEIDRCRPFFLCLLGDRFGWVPPPDLIPAPAFEEAGDLPSELARLYRRDGTSEPPVYRLRGDEALPAAVVERLVGYWESKGLPLAGESITSREIFHAAFLDRPDKMRCFFYFRRRPVQDHPAFPEALRPVFAESDPARRERLKGLKDRIARHGDRYPVREYDVSYGGLRIDPVWLPARMNEDEARAFGDGIFEAREWAGLSDGIKAALLARGTVALEGLEEFGDAVRQDLWAATEDELTAIPSLGRAAIESDAHERFIQSRTELFVGRDEVLDRLESYARDPSDNRLFVVSGPSGSGKSAVLSELVRRARERSSETCVLGYFVGASPDSTNASTAVRSIVESIRVRCGLEGELPAGPDELLAVWGRWLEQAGQSVPVLVVFDGLNQLDPVAGSRALGWLPASLPSGVKIVLSMLPGEGLDHLRRRVPADHVLDLPPLADRDRESVVREHLARKRKRLTAEQLALLLDRGTRPDSVLPLYLAVALEELSLHGDHQSVGERIQRLPPRLDGLFEQVLQRLEADHGAPLVSRVCRWLAASQGGLLEGELLDLLTAADGSFRPARWAFIYRALEAYLRPRDETTRSGLIAFFHDQLRQAAFERYFRMDGSEAEPTSSFREAHRDLAAYYRQVGANADGRPAWRADRPRALSALPRHLAASGQIEDLARLLSDFDFAEAKSAAGLTYELAADLGLARTLIRSQEGLLPLPTTELDEVAGLVRMEASRLARHAETPFYFVQSAYNSAERGRLADWAGERIKDPAASPAWVERLSRPPSVGEKRAHAGSLVGHEDSVTCLALSSDGCYLASGSNDETARLWDAETGETLAVFGLDYVASCLAFSPGGDWLAVGTGCQLIGHKGGLHLVNVGEREIRRLDAPHAVRSVGFDVDGRKLFAHDDQNVMMSWDIKSGEIVARYACLPGRPLRGPSRFLPGKGLVLVADEDGEGRKGRVVVWDLHAGVERAVFDHYSPVTALAVTPDERLAVSGGNRELYVWDLQTLTLKAALAGHWGRIRCVAISDDGRRAVTGGGFWGIGDYDFAVRVWDLERARLVRFYEGHLADVNAIALSRDGSGAFTGAGWAHVNTLGQRMQGWDNDIRVWNLSATENPVPDRLPRPWFLPRTQNDIRGSRHGGWVSAIGLSPDGRWACSGAMDGTLRIWSTESGTCLKALRTAPEEPDPQNPQGRGSFVKEVVVPSKKRAVALAHDTITVWDVETGRRLSEHSGIFEASLALCGDRSEVVARTPREVIVIDAESGTAAPAIPFAGTAGITPDGFAVALPGGPLVRLLDLDEGRASEFSIPGAAACRLLPGGLIISETEKGQEELWRVPAGALHRIGPVAPPWKKPEMGEHERIVPSGGRLLLDRNGTLWFRGAKDQQPRQVGRRRSPVARPFDMDLRKRASEQDQPLQPHRVFEGLMGLYLSPGHHLVLSGDQDVAIWATDSVYAWRIGRPGVPVAHPIQENIWTLATAGSIVACGGGGGGVIFLRLRGV